jgi:hypothetical protein
MPGARKEPRTSPTPRGRRGTGRQWRSEKEKNGSIVHQGFRVECRAETSVIKSIWNNWQYLIASLYTWIASTYFGAILLDIVYASIARRALKPSETANMLSQVADSLLCIGTLAALAAVGAIISAWNVGSARNLFIASAFFVVAEFLTPMLFFSLFQKIQVSLGFNVGPWVRLIGSALSSILAFVGLWKLKASKS